MGASHNNTHLQQTWKGERRGGEGGAALDKWQMGWAIGKLDFYALPGGCKQTNQLWIIIAHQSFSQSAPLSPSLSVCLASAESASSFDSKTKHTTGQGRRQTAGTGQVSNAGSGGRRKGGREECPEVMMILCAFAENFSVRFLRTFV